MPDLARLRTARQITVALIAGFVVAALLLGCVAYVVGRDAIESQIDARVDAEMTALHRLQRTGGRGALLAALAEREEKDVNSFGYLLLDPAGRRIAGDVIAPHLSPGWSSAVLRDEGGHRLAARSLTADLDAGLRLTVATETEPTTTLLRTTIAVCALVLVLLILIAVGCGVVFGRTIRGRLDRMNRAAAAITAGQLASRVEISGHGDEFDQLALTLNAMLDRIEALVANVRQVSSDVAHELRTPITRIQSRLEQLLGRFEPDTPEHSAIDAAIEDSENILLLFTALLRISEVESGSVRRYFRTLDLGEMASPLVDSYTAVAEDSGCALRFSIEPGLRVDGDRELLSQAIVNLIENALKHTPEGTEIVVTLARSGDGAVLVEVADDGPGVSEEARKSLPQRYLRLNRSGGVGGYGLGLTLVAAIADAHRGQVMFADNRPGLAVRLLLPAAATFPRATAAGMADRGGA